MVKEIEKLKYHIELIGNTIDRDLYLVESLIVMFYWKNNDFNKAHDIFEKDNKKIESKEKNINWIAFEKGLEEQFNINYQKVKLIILAFYKNRQWREVCYQYANANQCMEFDNFIIKYERDFKS